MSDYNNIFTMHEEPELPYNYDMSEESKRDMSYILFLLPTQTRTIKKLVDELLDRYEYSGSIIYDEYPDKSQLLNIIEELYSAPTFPIETSTQLPPNTNIDTNNNMSTLRSLAETIFLYEMTNRRRRYFNIINNIL